MSDDPPGDDNEGLPESLGRTIGCFALIAVFFVAVGVFLWFQLH